MNTETTLNEEVMETTTMEPEIVDGENQETDSQEPSADFSEIAGDCLIGTACFALGYAVNDMVKRHRERKAEKEAAKEEKKANKEPKKPLIVKAINLFGYEVVGKTSDKKGEDQDSDSKETESDSDKKEDKSKK